MKVRRVEMQKRVDDGGLVVMIDDSPTCRKIVEVCLRREEYAVVSFPDGVEAMRWLTTSGHRIPDLIFIDIQMPKMDGFEVVRLLRRFSAFTHTPLVMLSRSAGVVDRLKARLAGVQWYLTKPFTTQELLLLTQTITKQHTMGKKRVSSLC